MKLEARLLIGAILSHHLYILFLNTSTVHGIPVPDKDIWTAILALFIVILIYYYLKSPATTWYEKSLYVAILLSLAASILRSFGISNRIFSYSIILVAIAILTTAPLITHHHGQIKVMLLGIYSIEILLILARVFEIENITPLIGPIVELAIIVGLLYYNYAMGFQFDELFLVVIATLIGWYLGDYIYTLKVPALIISTFFEQTLSVGQYSIIEGIEPRFFLALHMAEVFNLLFIQFLARRSWRAIGIVLVGIDMTYPPILGFRALVILAFLRDTIDNVDKTELEDKDESVENTQAM